MGSVSKVTIVIYSGLETPVEEDFENIRDAVNFLNKVSFEYEV